MNFRSRSLLDLAHRVEICTNCGAFSSHGCEPAHQNGQASGKGIGIKGRDNRHAALCHPCHAWLDQGTGLDPSHLFEGNRAGKAEMWIRAHLATYDVYWIAGWIRVV